MVSRKNSPCDVLEEVVLVVVDVMAVLVDVDVVAVLVVSDVVVLVTLFRDKDMFVKFMSEARHHAF